LKTHKTTGNPEELNLQGFVDFDVNIFAAHPFVREYLLFLDYWFLSLSKSECFYFGIERFGKSIGRADYSNCQRQCPQILTKFSVCDLFFSVSHFSAFLAFFSILRFKIF
jgi:hypothetical protein